MYVCFESEPTISIIVMVFIVIVSAINIKTDFRMDDAPAEAGDPCHSYTWSILFCIVMVLALLAWVVALALVCLHHHDLHN